MKSTGIQFNGPHYFYFLSFCTSLNSKYIVARVQGERCSFQIPTLLNQGLPAKKMY